jgi:hypothetical protein
MPLVRLFGGVVVSSLRPLITITLLAVVGVVLYMKINETEPVIPAGVGEWTAGPLDVGGVEAGAKVPNTAPPAYAADAAPAFVPESATASASAPAGDTAPAWTPPPVAAAATETPPAAADSALGSSPTANADSSPIARSAEPSAAGVPEMPALPGTATETGAAAKMATTETAPPLSPPAAAGAPQSAEASPVAGASDGASAASDAASKAETPVADAPAQNAVPTVAAVAAGTAGAAALAAAQPRDPITPTPSAEPATAAAAPAAAKAEYASARIAVQSALDRGELDEALKLLSPWYDDPALTPAESAEVNTWLGQLAGSVIYEGPPAHRLEKPYKVQAGETLQQIADKYDVPAALLAKINGIADPNQLQPGQELKVLRGPFMATVDLSEHKLTLQLDRRYAGRFTIELDPASTIEEGQWRVEQKLLTPGGGGLYAQAAGNTDDRSLMLVNPANPTGQTVVVRGPGNDPATAQPANRTIRVNAVDMNDLYDILSEKSRVTVRR